MIDTILFDLDGTIVDTNELIIASFMHVMNHSLTREEIIPHMGTTLEQQLRTFSGQEDVAPLVKAYREYNSLHHDEMVAPFPEVNEVLAQLQAQGIKMGVVTTKIRATTTRVLGLFDLDQYMQVIVTLDDVEHPKPDAEPIRKALEALGSAPERTLMVGDSPADLKSATAAGVQSAAVAWSLKGEQELCKYEPTFVIHRMSDLYNLVLADPVDR